MSDRSRAVEQVEAWVRERLEAANQRAHGWLHTDRVRRHILILAPAEGVDPLLAELAALLHDVGRTEPGPENEHGVRSAAMAGQILASLPLTDVEREALLHAVRWHNSGRDDTSLLCILRDADMLDGLGAIGIMRAFMSKGHLPPYDPGAPFEESDDGWPAAHASDQVLGQARWYDWLNTDTARQIAADRTAFMHTFVAQILLDLARSGWN
jgi:uncharacterized protein